jgi:Beta-galactosidase, domain 2/Beta-galactosidase second all-beta domain
LWNKYYQARSIALFLGMFGSVLTRAKRQEDAAQSTNPAVSVTGRANSQSGVLFVRENANAGQQYKMTFVDPASPSHRIISVPRQGQLALGAREMKMLAVQVPLETSTLRYSTSEVLAHGLSLDREFLILYDEPGRLAEIALATSREPQVNGNTEYLYWDNEYESVVIGVRFAKEEQTLVVNESLNVVLVPRERALRTWVAEFPGKTLPDEADDQDEEEQQQAGVVKEAAAPIAIPFISDAALLASSGSQRDHLWVDLNFSPGEHAVSLVLPDNVIRCQVDGDSTQFQYDSPSRTARLTLATPALPAAPLELAQVRTWVEQISSAASGEWVTSALKPLEEFGRIPYGYVKYRLEHLALDPQSKLFISTFADDAKKVFLNGQLLPDASTPAKQVAFELAKYAKPADNRLEISYELFGSPNFGESMAELKGLESVRVGADFQSATALGPWQIQRFPVPMRGREIDPQAPADGWSEASSIGGSGSREIAPAFAWCRADFTISQPAEEWFAPWKLTFEAERDALLYLNGKFVGRYVTEGPQQDFYLPEPYLNLDAKNNNILTIVLAYAASAAPIRTLRLAPYQEYATRRTRIVFEW